MELTYAQAFNIIANVSGQAPLTRNDHDTVTNALQKLKELVEKEVGTEGVQDAEVVEENG
jgi:hypothetical protein